MKRALTIVGSALAIIGWFSRSFIDAVSAGIVLGLAYLLLGVYRGAAVPMRAFAAASLAMLLVETTISFAHVKLSDVCLCTTSLGAIAIPPILAIAIASHRMWRKREDLGFAKLIKGAVANVIGVSLLLSLVLFWPPWFFLQWSRISVGDDVTRVEAILGKPDSKGSSLEGRQPHRHWSCFRWKRGLIYFDIDFDIKGNDLDKPTHVFKKEWSWTFFWIS